MELGNSVWDREDSPNRGNLSQATYATAVSVFTTVGIITAAAIGYCTMNMIVNPIFLISAGLVAPIVGIIIALNSKNWLISFIGYLMVCVGLGAIVGPTVAIVESAVVVKALLATAGVTFVMSLAGAIYPKSLEHWSIYLFAGLLALIFVRLGQMLFIATGTAPALWYLPIIEYGAALLFSLYIMYDWNRAMRLPYTLDNAVDCAMAIFLDIINLFITLLRIFSHDK